METEHSAFFTTVVHNATHVVSLRMMDTGVAKDVSGVMRITFGGADSAAGGGRDEETKGKGAEDELVGEKEVLYYVGEGGGCQVKIFDRGMVRHG